MVTAVTGKRKHEIGLVVQGKFTCLTKKFRLADILHDELAKKKKKYSHFELEQIELIRKDGHILVYYNKIVFSFEIPYIQTMPQISVAFQI